MKKLLSVLFSAFVALCHVDASAQVHYRNCDTGSVSCTPGTNGPNSGTDPAFPRLTLPTNEQINALPGGSIVRLCNGAVWDDANAPSWLLQNPNATRDNPIIIEGWDCGNGVTTRPRLRWPANATAAILFGGFCQNDCPAPDHGGYIIRGIEFTKAGSLTTGSEAFQFYGSTRWATFENNEVHNWANAFSMATSTAQNLRDITIRNNYIHRNSQNAVVGSASDLVIEGNTLELNNMLPAPCNPTSSCPPYGDTFALEHALYIGGDSPKHNVVIRRNTLINNSTRQATQQCESGNITFRGDVDQVTIEENVIVVPNATANCYGISIIDGYSSDLECVRRAMLRGNTIVNVGTSIALRLTRGGTVENNRIIRTTTTGSIEGLTVTHPGSPGDTANCPMGDMTIRNNSFDIRTASTGTILSVSQGAGHKVFNNAIRVLNTGMNCFGHQSLGNYSAWRTNWCENPGNWSSVYANLGLAQAAGFDTDGGNTATGFTIPTSENNWLLEPGANLRNVGINTVSERAPARDALWCQRDSTPDVGAQEYQPLNCLTVRAPGRVH